jgi:hypothetical protein
MGDYRCGGNTRVGGSDGAEGELGERGSNGRDGMSCCMKKTLFLAVREANVEKTGANEAVEKDSIEIWKRPLTHRNAECLNRNYSSESIDGTQEGYS